MSTYYTIKKRLTSDSSGDASAVTESITGELISIVSVPGASTVQPTTNFDLDLQQANLSGGVLDLTLFTDDTVVNNAVTQWLPTIPATKSVDGSASVLTEKSPVIFGPITIIGANMGNSKIADIILVIKTV